MFMRSQIIIAAVVSLSVVSTGVAQQGQQPPQAESSRRVCTQQYDPVCGRRGTSYRTFGNACEAQVSGYFVDHQGQCDIGRNDRSQNDPQVFCTREYKPVCGIGRNGRKTFDNACGAEAAGYRIVHGGQC